MTKCDVSASSTNLIYNRTGIWTCSVFRRGKILEKSLILGAEKMSQTQPAHGINAAGTQTQVVRELSPQHNPWFR